MDRRSFLVRSGAALGAAAMVAQHAVARPGDAAPSASSGSASDWAWLRAQFDLDPQYTHFAGFFLASHPRPVREAIERHRKALDRNPIGVWHEHHIEYEDRVRRAAGEYLGVNGEEEIALTDSTTMGLGLLYNGLRLRPGQEILTSEHDHYATHQSLRFRAERDGAEFRKVRLYQDGSDATVDGIVGAVERGITDRTRILALTWVHSCSGVKLPVRAVADMVARVNARRDEADRVIFCVDGVHGLGIEDRSLPDLGCDFFSAGTHKWMFGPRGTGLLWGRKALWPLVVGTIPPFGPHDKPATLQTPGGFHSFEHRWAAEEAFAFHVKIGKRRVQDRIHELNARIREGLAGMPHVDLHTPRDAGLASGIVCFDVKGMTPAEVVERCMARKIIASESPYTPSCARLSASLWNTEDEIDSALAAVASMA